MTRYENERFQTRYVEIENDHGTIRISVPPTPESKAKYNTQNLPIWESGATEISIRQLHERLGKIIKILDKSKGLASEIDYLSIGRP